MVFKTPGQGLWKKILQSGLILSNKQLKNQAFLIEAYG